MVTRRLKIYNVLNIIGILIILLIMIMGLTLYLAPHFGWVIDGVRSNSMAPEIERGHLVIGQPVPPESIAINDIIISRPVAVGENLLVHRVIKIENNSPLFFTTKGDANPLPDPDPVPAKNVEAKVVAHTPIIGFAAIFLKTPVGFATSLALPGIIVALLLLQSISSELKKKGTSKN